MQRDKSRYVKEGLESKKAPADHAGASVSCIALSKIAQPGPAPCVAVYTA